MSRNDSGYDLRAIQEASRSGAIRVATLETLGVSSQTAYRRCQPGGPWQRPLPGIVLLSSLPPTRRQLVEAALLYGGEDAQVTGLEACRLHGMRRLPDQFGIHLLVPADRRLLCTGVVTVERTERLPKPDVRDGVPVAPLTRSVLDASRRLRLHDPVRALITEAVQRGGVHPRSLLHELETGSRRGTAVPRAVLKDVLTGARSVAEIDAMRVWKRTGLPPPVWNVALNDRSGRYIATPDAWFAEVRLAWEIDSFEFHFQRDDYAATISRNTRYAAAGITVLQTLPARLRTEPDQVAAELRAAYEAAQHRAVS